MSLGSEGTKTRVMDALKEGSVSLLHIAAHGTLQAANKHDVTLGELKLASGQSIYAVDVQSMQLDVMELVVLSGCETGAGERRNWRDGRAGNVSESEGVVGWYRAFLVAGARTVIASLWKVPDCSATMLMQRFYAGLLATDSTGCRRTVSKGTALREAMMWMREQPAFANPVHWAPFVLVGDAFSSLQLPF
jgi:CHAT domain-containing protein